MRHMAICREIRQFFTAYSDPIIFLHAQALAPRISFSHCYRIRPNCAFRILTRTPFSTFRMKSGPRKVFSVKVADDFF
jgi:hypothetical protein